MQKWIELKKKSIEKKWGGIELVEIKVLRNVKLDAYNMSYENIRLLFEDIFLEAREAIKWLKKRDPLDTQHRKPFFGLIGHIAAIEDDIKMLSVAQMTQRYNDEYHTPNDVTPLDQYFRNKGIVIEIGDE